MAGLISIWTSELILSVWRHDYRVTNGYTRMRQVDVTDQNVTNEWPCAYYYSNRGQATPM